MSLLDLSGSYFAIPDPLRRWRHRMRHRQPVLMGHRWLELRWTARAESELAKRDAPLVVELQLLFSCVVKKRVVFHDTADFERVRAAPRIELAWRPLASAACDPVTFARSYPAGRAIAEPRAARMIPRWAEIDYRRGGWQGRFGY